MQQWSQCSVWQHLAHRRGQVVVADLPGRDPAQYGERVHVAFQEGFLPAGREHLVHRLAGLRQAEHEQITLGHHPGQPHPQLTEVDLGVLAGRVMLRHEHLRRAKSNRLYAIGFEAAAGC